MTDETTDFVIPTEAVEAATRSFKAELFEGDSLLHPMLANSAQWEARHKMRAALEAALPHLRPLVEAQELRLATEVALKLGRQEMLREVLDRLTADGGVNLGAVQRALRGQGEAPTEGGESLERALGRKEALDEVTQRLTEAGARGRFALQIVQHLDEYDARDTGKGDSV